MITTTVKFVLELIGLATVVWFVWIVAEEYKKIRRKENEDGHG